MARFMPEAGAGHGVCGRAPQESSDPDWAAVRDLIDAYTRSFGLAYDDRQDVVQRSSMKVWTRWTTFRGQSERSSWIYRVVRNEFLSWARREKAHKNVLPDWSRPSGLSVSSHEDEVLVEVVAQRWLSLLPLMDRRILELRYSLELTSDEIGAATGLAGSSVRARLHRLRSRVSAHNLE